MKISTIAFLILIQFATLNAFGQSIDGYAINTKLGNYFDGNKSGGVFGLEFNIRRNGFIYSADYYDHKERMYLNLTEPLEYFNGIGIKIGQYKGEKRFRFQYQVGLATFCGRKRTELIGKYVRSGSPFYVRTYDSEQYETVGFTSKIGLKFVALRFLSIGLDVETNINSKNSFWMPMLSIEIGRLRDKL